MSCLAFASQLFPHAMRGQEYAKEEKPQKRAIGGRREMGSKSTLLLPFGLFSIIPN
jgi:hypothetical protein